MVGGKIKDNMDKNSSKAIGIDTTKVTYDTWLIGFDKDQNITDYEVFLNSNDTKEEAIKYAQNIDKNKLQLREDIPASVTSLALVVELVGTDYTDCVSFNMQNLYEEFIELDK